MDEDEESQADGFVVDDGYLSAGEGGPIDNDDFGAKVEGATDADILHCGFRAS